MKNLLHAFKAHTPFENIHCKHAHPDGFCDIAFVDKGIFDVLHVREENGRITWVDFTHTTDLGPIDGTEIFKRLETFTNARNN